MRERLSLTLRELPADLPARYLPAVSQLDLAAVQAAARWFRADTGITVIVGPVEPADLERPGGPTVEVVRAP